MIDEQLRQELIAMRAEDQRVRQELVEAGELGGSYVPRMEAVHVRNAERLKELVMPASLVSDGGDVWHSLGWAGGFGFFITKGRVGAGRHRSRVAAD